MKLQKTFIGVLVKSNKMKNTHHILTQLLITTMIFSCGNDSENIVDDQNIDQDSLVIEEAWPLLNEFVPVAYDQKLLKICIDSIWNCPKVTTKNGDWRESSNGEMGLSMIQIDAEDRIYLDFGENNDLRFVNYWTFIVEPSNNYRISFYDVMEDENIDFGEWCGGNR
ncbi:MAG: hypothetical protein ACI8ZM_005059 [Crocinitomix sp.]|jgi:hypothetical protein